MEINIQQAYAAAKKEIETYVRSIKNDLSTQKKMEEVFNTFYNKNDASNTVSEDYLTQNDMSAILKYVETVVDAGVDQMTLNVNPEQAYLSQKNANSKITPLKVPETKNTVPYTIGRRDVQKVVSRIRQALSSGNFDNAFVKEATLVLQELKNLESKAHARGFGFKINDNNVSLIRRLNLLYSQINFSVLETVIGDIGEYFAGAALAAAETKSAGEVDEIINIFEQGIDKKFQVVGTTGKSKHYQATYSQEKEGIKANVNATQDKVDVIVNFDGADQHLSVKNYKNIASISIFSGNLLSLLSNPAANNLLRAYSTLTSKKKNTANYYLLKQISFIRALTGGQLAVGTDGGIIDTGTAEYLVVNEQGKKFHIWSTREIAERILSQHRFNEGVGKFKPDFPTTNLIKKDDYVQSTFQSHIYLLTKSLK